MEVEVRLRRTVPGCVYWPAVIVSFGLVALIVRLGERAATRHFIQKMDEAGVLTRGGTHIAWNEFISIVRVQGRIGKPGSMDTDALSDEYALESGKGMVSLPLWRIENRQKAMDYFFEHLPPHLSSGSR